MKLAYTLSRYLAALLMLVYGFAKLNGAQFTILDSQLDKPMGEVSGFWLTWYYFGYSPVYGNLIAVAQILGGILLTFRKTALLGSCLLFPMVTNIILITLFYAIDPGAFLAAFAIEAALVIILVSHKAELIDLFWSRQNSLLPPAKVADATRYGKHVLRALMIVIPLLFTYWVANYNNRLPTPLDGVWEVVEVSPQVESATEVPAMIFFERNRAFLAVFKHRNGSYEDHHFEVVADTHTITIWQDWLQKGATVFDGNYELSGTQLRLNGRLANHLQEVGIVLKKRK
jgi:hypothetical protein